MSTEKRKHWFWCTSGMIEMYANSDRRGYIPGQKIVIDATFDNRAKKDVVLRATLIQKCQFHVGSNNKHALDHVYGTNVYGTPIMGGDNANWYSIQLQIPTDLTPSILNCPLMKVNYAVELVLQIPRANNTSQQPLDSLFLSSSTSVPFFG